MADEWKPIDSAPKDGTVVWAAVREDLFPSVMPEREDLKRWNGVYIPVKHPGVCDDGFDVGWNIAAPVGHGGFPDAWFAGWRPLPPPPSEEPQ